VPLRVVLRGVTDAFDAHAHSFARRQKIRSLKFCEDQITAAVDRYRRALQAEGPGPRRRGDAIEMLAERVGALSAPPEIAEAVAAARLGLQVVVESAGQEKTFNADQALAEIEDRLVGNVSSALGPEALAAMDKAARDLTAAYRSRMPAKVYETLIGESVRRKILQRFGLPRFLLAEIE